LSKIFIFGNVYQTTSP